MTFIQIDSHDLPSQSDAQYQSECIAMTGTKCLHWLRQWCQEHRISMTSWKNLHATLKQYIESQGQFKAAPEVWCCVNESILELESRSHSICDQLGLVLLEENGCWGVYDGNILKGTVNRCPWNGFVTNTIKIPGVSDRYTAALSLVPSADSDRASLKMYRASLEASLVNTPDDSVEYF